MVREKHERNGRLEEAMVDLQRAQANLVQAQALLVQNQAACQSQIAESNRQSAEWQRQSAEWQKIASERFARIEAILMEHSRILRAMPDAVREKIGFKAPEPTKQGE